MDLGGLSETLKSLAIEVGYVFKMTFYPEDGVTPKSKGDTSRDKYFVILGKDEEKVTVGNVLINSDINPSLAHVIYASQLCIYPEDYPFLGDKYRYVDCYQIKEISIERIQAEAQYIGMLNEEDIQKAKDLVRNSPAIPAAVLKKFGLLD